MLQTIILQVNIDTLTVQKIIEMNVVTYLEGIY